MILIQLLKIILQTQDDIISAHIKDNPDGKVAGYEDIIRECGHTYQVHYRTVSFGSTWKSDSLKPAGFSIIYHDGAHTNFRFPSINRLTSLDENGLVACSGFEDMCQLQIDSYTTLQSQVTLHHMKLVV